MGTLAPRSRPRSAQAVLLASLVLLALAPSASAATRVGVPELGTAFNGTSCATSCVLVSTTAAGYEVPFDGVLTRWIIRAAGGNRAGGETRLRIMRPDVAPDKYRFVRSSPPITVPATTSEDVIVETPARIRVNEGQLLGVQVPGGNAVALRTYGYSGVRRAVFEPAPGDLSSATATSTANDVAYGIQGFVEEDADRDGFGDETQDGCPTDASASGPCPAPPAPPEPQIVTVEKQLPAPAPVVVPGAAPAPPTVAVSKATTNRRRRNVLVGISCPASRATACTGTMLLRSSSAVRIGKSRSIVVLGTATFTVSPGTTTGVTVGLRPDIRRLFAKKRSVNTTATVFATDAPATVKRLTITGG